VLRQSGGKEYKISVGDANQVIFAGSTVVVNPDADLSASASYTLEMGSGVVVDLSGNAYAGLSGYGFATAATATQGAQFVSLANAKLVKDAANNKSTVSFSINMNAGVLDGTKVNGVLFDLDYDHTKVSAARLSGVQYDSSGESTPVWQFLTPNLSGSTANGKIVGVTTTDASNPVVVSGKTMDVTLVLNQAVDSFKLGFNKQSAHVYTVDGVDHSVATGADVVALPNAGYALKATAVHWKGLSGGTSKVLGDVSLVKGSQTMKTASTGEAVFETSTDAKASVVVAKAVAESEKVAAASSVNLTDAIGILKMIVGLNVNATGTALSPYQVVAADFNQDGTVGLTDAIDVLKAVVGLTAPSPGWVVLDQTKVSSTLTMDSYNGDATKKQASGWMAPTLSVDLDTSQEVKLVGVLAGDVDGSWAG
jgi:Ni,Fe-hydrogenase III small subunit